MKEKINEETLCVLKKNTTNRIVVGYVDILNPLKIVVDGLSE